MYKIEYLTSAINDMLEIVRYISHKLNNPTSAIELAQEFVDSATNLNLFPYANTVYIPIKPLKYEYRKLLVKNYVMFYWIDEEKKCITIARVIYNKRNYNSNILE